MTADPLEGRLRDVIGDVRPVDEAAAVAARERQAGLLKPPGSLGRLEWVSERLAAIASRVPPPVPVRPAVVVATGDHGVHAQGVTAWPQELTALMTGLLCEGGPAVRVVADSVGAQVAVLDVGVAGEVASHPLLRSARVRPGTADLSQGPAMTRPEALRAILAGEGIVEELVAAGVDLVVPGDMGIANTTAAACLTGALTGVSASAVTGPGAGAQGEALERKRAVVAGALARLSADADPVGVLAEVGGLEHAALVGVLLAAAANGLPIVLDGVSTTAAALVADALCPTVRGYLLAGHRSSEPGASAALDRLGLQPLLDLELRLGEGTGGLLAVPLVVAAARILGEMGQLADVVPAPGHRPPPGPGADADVGTR